MLPFAQKMQNQSSSSSVPPRASAPLHQQVPGAPSNMFPNLVQMQPQLGFINPQLSNPFNNNNSNNNNNNGFNLNMVNGVRPQGFMNMPNFNALQQNSLLGSLQALQQQCQPQPGFCQQNFGQNLGFMGQNMIPGNTNQNQGLGNFGGWQNQGQNMNQLGGGGVMLNPAQVAALSQLMGCVNQVAQGMLPQNAAFLGNPQLGLVQPNGGLQQLGNFPPQLQNVSAMPFNPALAQPQLNQTPNLQGSHSKNQGMHISNARHNQNRNFVNNSRRDASNLGSPKPKHQQINKGGKGMESADPKNSANQSKTEKRKPLFLLYTDKEIQKWREERKKNYPTKDIVQKKLSQKQANADAADEEAKLRRQQLKEVLAKQVELGFEVPEIPSHYMSDDETVSHGKGRNKRQFSNGRHQNRFNKRGKFDRNNRFPSKRNTDDNNQLSEEHEHSATTKLKEEETRGRKTPVKEPSLMQKLLSADMKRDNNRLLQVFRFMTMNSFFMDKTEEPLNFPAVVVKETGDVNNDESSLKELIGSVEANGGCQEEGEITD